MTDPLGVVVADDHPAIVEAVCRYLGRDDEVQVVGRAADGDQALRLIVERRPALAVLDVRMPGLGGVEVARAVAERSVATAPILYTGFAERALLLEALDAGVRGFVLKEAPLEDLRRALHVVARGGTYVDAALGGVLTSPSVAARLTALTKREREVLRLLADGMRNEQVGRELAISPLTVRTHVKNLMDKLEADTRTEAVANALRRSLIR